MLRTRIDRMSGRTHSYLIRLAEAGREAQASHRKLRRDVGAAIARCLPGSRMRTDVGRIFLETEEDASSALAEVRSVEKAAVRDRVPEVAYRLYEEFTACDACDKIYWRGGQYERILSRLEGILEE